MKLEELIALGNAMQDFFHEYINCAEHGCTDCPLYIRGCAYTKMQNAILKAENAEMEAEEIEKSAIKTNSQAIQKGLL